MKSIEILELTYEDGSAKVLFATSDSKLNLFKVAAELNEILKKNVISEVEFQADFIDTI